MMTKIHKDGHNFWFNSDEQLHREDGPACEYSGGTKCWYINGKRHRDDGPACEIVGWKGNINEWWIKGKPITKKVKQWIKDNDFPEYEDWTDSIKVFFKLTFG